MENFIFCAVLWEQSFAQWQIDVQTAQRDTLT